jgi:hypothetical protein
MPDPLALSELFPAPEGLTLAGREVVVRPLRLRDLLELERSLATLAPSSWELLATDDGSPPPRRKCREALKAARDWPPRMGSGTARDLLLTVGGSAAFLMACAAAPLSADDAIALALDMTAADWSAVGRVAWGVRPAEAIRRMVEGTEDADEDGEPAEPADWCAVIDRIARERHLGYEAILDLPLVQVGHMLRAGEPPADGTARDGPMDHLRRMADGAKWYDPDEELPDYLVRARDDLAYAEAHGLDALAALAAARGRMNGVCPPPTPADETT